MDIDGGADVEPLGRVPIVGPAGPLAVLCGVLGGAVGLGAEVGCDLPPVAGAVGFVADFAGAEAGESLIDPTCRPEPCCDDPEAGGSPGASTEEDCDNGAPLVPATPVEVPAVFVG